jgi:hypothetical protein
MHAHTDQLTKHLRFGRSDWVARADAQLDWRRARAARRKLPPHKGTIESLHSRTGINLLCPARNLEQLSATSQRLSNVSGPRRAPLVQVGRECDRSAEPKGKRPATEATMGHGGEDDSDWLFARAELDAACRQTIGAYKGGKGRGDSILCELLRISLCYSRVLIRFCWKFGGVGD